MEKRVDEVVGVKWHVVAWRGSALGAAGGRGSDDDVRATKTATMTVAGGGLPLFMVKLPEPGIYDGPRRPKECKFRVFRRLFNTWGGGCIGTNMSGQNKKMGGKRGGGEVRQARGVE